MTSDLTFITNESGKSLHDRFGVLVVELEFLVYALYGLTPEGIKIVEGQTK